jgi:hypothetical protein
MPAVIPPPISEAGYHAFRDPTSDITEDAKAGLRPHDTDVYITEDNRNSKYISKAMSHTRKRRSHMSKNNCAANTLCSADARNCIHFVLMCV